MSCEGGFEQTRFLGASVTNFSASVGWNEQTSSLTVTLAEDTENGDSFTRPATGTPVTFEFGDFIFSGIIQSWDYRKSVSGFTYEVIINDPREILDGCQLILDGYSGTTESMPNLWNPFGYWENTDIGVGFGGSKTNEAGMPWIKILEALEVIKDGSTSFGTQLQFKGYTYTVDFSELPTPPDFYRIPGGSATLLQAISQLCSDAGYDYLVNLNIGDENTISFSLVSRKQQVALDAIDQFIATKENVSVKNIGRELRNEITSSFVVGGNKERLWRSTFGGSGSSASIWPFWGLDRSGNAIIGEGFDDEHQFTVPCDIGGLEALGGYYTITVLELRAVLMGFDEWRAYMRVYKSDICDSIGLQSTLNLSQALALITNNSATNIDLQNTSAQAISWTSNDLAVDRADKLFAFVKSYGENFYGKKFMVTVPFVVAAYQSETSQLITSSEPSDAGYLERGEGNVRLPLNLPSIYEDLFTTEDGRFTTFVKFNNAQNFDVDNLSPDVCYVYNWELFIKCDIQPNFVYLNRDAFYGPRAVITLPGPVNTRYTSDNPPMQLALLLKLFQEEGGSRDDFEALRERLAQFPVSSSLSPAANIPHHAAVPLRSNISTYGPWYVIGPAGKVNFEKDDSLVPWNFGGYLGLDLAGNAKVENALMAQQEGETGVIEFAGLPDKQLGDQLVTDGPNITDINVSIDTSGAKTTYRLRTFTPVFGKFNRQFADRFQRINRANLSIRRNMLSTIRNGGNSAINYLQNINRRYLSQSGLEFIGRSPHEMLVSTYFTTTAGKSGCITSTSKLAEAVSILQGKNRTNYETTGAMSFEGLLRGYSVDINVSSMPHFESGIQKAGNDISFKPRSFDYFPFTGTTKSSLGNTDTDQKTDVKVLAHSDTYPEEGINTYLSSHLRDKAKGIGLSGPVVVVGWGYDLFNKPVPNSANDGDEVNLPTLGDSTFLSDFREKPHKWKVGPVDLRWDQMRKVWTFPYIIPGEYNGNYTMKIWYGLTSSEDTGITMPVAHYFDLTSVSSGIKVLAYPIAGELVVVSADC